MPLKRQRLNPKPLVPSTIIPNPNSNVTEPLVCRAPRSHPLDINSTTTSHKPVGDALIRQPEISKLTNVIPNSPTDYPRDGTVIPETPLQYSNNEPRVNFNIYTLNWMSFLRYSRPSITLCWRDTEAYQQRGPSGPRAHKEFSFSLHILQ